MQIEDGLGKGVFASVTEENRLQVFSSTIRRISQVSLAYGMAFVWSAYVDWGANKNALWLRNDSPTKLLHIDSFIVSCPAAAVLRFLVGTGNTVGGTVVTGVNMNRTSGKIAPATCRHSNTNVDAGTGMTTVQYFHVPASQKTILNLEGTLILGTNNEVAVNIVTDVGASAVSINGYFHGG